MDKNRIIENKGRISVLAGKNQVDEMLVFLACRKLKKELAGFSFHNINKIKQDRKE